MLCHLSLSSNFPLCKMKQTVLAVLPHRGPEGLNWESKYGSAFNYKNNEMLIVTTQ